MDAALALDFKVCKAKADLAYFDSPLRHGMLHQRRREAFPLHGRIDDLTLRPVVHLLLPEVLHATTVRFELGEATGIYTPPTGFHTATV